MPSIMKYKPTIHRSRSGNRTEENATGIRFKRFPGLKILKNLGGMKRERLVWVRFMRLTRFCESLNWMFLEAFQDSRLSFRCAHLLRYSIPFLVVTYFSGSRLSSIKPKSFNCVKHSVIISEERFSFAINWDLVWGTMQRSRTSENISRILLLFSEKLFPRGKALSPNII